MRESIPKTVLAGAAAGLVVWWSVYRFYRMARDRSHRHATAPYCAGVGIGIAYGAFFLRHDARPIARVPLGAAMYLAAPERTAAPPQGGRDVSEKAGNFALCLVSRGLKKAAEMTLSA